MRMAASELRYGIVGCAGMGDTHARAIEAIDGASLVACADVDEGNARSFASDYGTAWYTDSAEMAVDAELDLVSVCTPNGTHLEIVTDFAEAGVNVLCEKPLEITPDRVDRLIGVCEREGVVLGGILQRRTLGGVRLARDAVADGRLGDLIFGDVQVKWHRKQSYYDDAWHGSTALDGGILFTQALHGIDLLQWATGGIDRIAAELDTLHHDIEVPDTAVASVEFTDGGYGQITATTAMYPQQPIALRLHGTQGTIQWHEDRSEREGADREDRSDREDEFDEFETMGGSADATPEPFHLGTGIPGQIRDFVTAIREERDPMVPPREARKALEIAFAAQKAARCGEWIEVAGLRPTA